MSSMDVEVTQDDFRRVSASHLPPATKPPKNLSARLNNLFKGKHSSASTTSSDRATVDSNDVESIAASTAAGNVTVASNDTIKMSNRTTPLFQEAKTKHFTSSTDSKKNPWRKLKKMMANNKKELEDDEFEEQTSFFSPGRSRSLSNPSVMRVDNAYPIRKRGQSDNSRTQTSSQNSASNDQEIDDAIRGRFDGMDILSLGSARLVSTPRPPDLLTRDAPMVKAPDLVTDMLRTSAGRNPPELILEGFIASDRWLVRIESSVHSDGVPQLQSTDDESSMDGSPTLSTPKLLASIWGRDRTPPPSHAQPENVDKDDVFQLAASCSVPIDIDEETFIIDTPAHCQAVHDIAAVPLKAGRFDDAIAIFKKILKGLEMRHGDEPHHLIGTTLHNIGVLQLWQGQYQEAWENFNQAASIRIQSLSKNHPDIAVSLGREAIALFALEKWNDALHVLEKSLTIICNENATRAKIFNNMGVVHYHRRDNMQAMASFAAALEIQRLWLDNRVRRNSIIFDASITMGNMGKLYLEEENYHLSFFVNEEALLLQTTAFPKDHDIVLRSLDSIAYARTREGDYEKAIHLYRGILRSQDSRFGPNSKESMETTKLMGTLLIKQEDYEEALRCFTTLLKWQKAHLPKNNARVIKTKDTIHKIETALDGEGASVWV